MNTAHTDAHTSDIARSEISRRATTLWRRAGVRRTDRRTLLTELDTELDAAQHDGHAVTSVLGHDSDEMLRSWAHEREMSGRALRVELVLPAAFIGIITGLGVMLVALAAGFSGRSTTFDAGPLILPFYASSALLGYLCALLCVGGVLRLYGDPHAASTTRWLAALLPIGATLTAAAAIALAWWRNFNTSTAVFVAVIAVVIVGLTLTIALSRLNAVHRNTPSE
ncbi:hypothetical protein [Rhodococcus sp. H29-C3]|uniref:hypothetical protein n=1 Tax=Rhodococcus sp. H29-C3 TaxID=3046307 RepID=UPI0024BB7A3E|nr:hypothetical protein [Rhodococcus sp. H29-C3]MDJ0363469.1 hypothetical protein [Rhodococcus sp. H29-C3]